MPPAPPRTRALSFHADYACRSSGACCTAGWAIPVEPEIERTLTGALRTRTLVLRGGRPLLEPRADLPDGARVVLGLDPDGRCRAFEPERGRLCAVHRQLGHESLPASCRHFPRVALLTPLATEVTLSHFCPSAAALLFRDDDEPTRIVDDAPAFPPSRAYEGLDARPGPPPLLRPGVFLGWEGHALWEEHVVRTLARDDAPVETALASLAADAEEARVWRPEQGRLVDWLSGIAGRPFSVRPPLAPGDLLPLHAAVAASVPLPHAAPDVPSGFEDLHARRVAPSWPKLARPVRRYLAAKAFASWCAVQGGGLRTAVRALAAAWAVLQVEATRACADAGRGLDADLLREAFRASDLLLAHLVSPEDLARRLSAGE